LPASRSAGEAGEGSPEPPPLRLTPAALRSLAARHGIRPDKSLGQNFLIEPALAERIATLAELGPQARVLEVGAGLGSLTRALARTGATVVAVEFDRRLVPALEEAVAGFVNVRIEVADAMKADWGSVLDGPGPWAVVANLPYNVAVPVVMRLLDEEPRVRRFLIMVQREVGMRLVARPGDEQYGAVSVRVAYRAEGRVLRRVAPSVFWPRPTVDSVLVSLARRSPPVEVDEAALWEVIGEAFAQRRKTMRNAMLRLGLEATEALEILAECAVDSKARAEELGLPEFACLATAWCRARPPGGAHT
jgi:16S rRNA (adenine1518-N6/adenine1519-N6)-dimethyltransferase